jgi:hypothetical protein
MGDFMLLFYLRVKQRKSRLLIPKKDSKTIEASPSFKTGIVPSEKEVPMTRDEAYRKLCELVESEDFNLLDKTLQERILSKKRRLFEEQEEGRGHNLCRKSSRNLELKRLP